MQLTHVSAGETIFSAGDPSAAVYVIEDGEVAITVDNGIEVARLHAGELFGEAGVLEKRVRSASATAVVPTRLLITDAETFSRAFGMEDERALALVKLLCAKLRSTTQRVAHPNAPLPGETANTAIRLLPGSDRLVSEFAMPTVDVKHLPFQVGNRYGGEILPIASNHSCNIPARGDPTLAAPHFEILRRDGRLGVRDLGTRNGTIVNGTPITRNSPIAFVPLHNGDNDVIAGTLDSPFRFRLKLQFHQVLQPPGCPVAFRPVTNC